MLNQILPTASPGTAIWQDVEELNRLFIELGYRTKIYAENIHPRLRAKVKHYRSYRPRAGEVLIYHYSIGSTLNQYLLNLTGIKVVLVYHNITPAHFFTGFSERLRNLVSSGRQEISFWVNRVALAIADSEYNRQELLSYGFKQVEVVPIILDFAKYLKVPLNDKIKLKDGNQNILFVGRVAPNKKIEDLIKIVYVYQRTINLSTRLVIVGSYAEEEYRNYYSSLKGLVNNLNMHNVWFTGQVSFNELVNIYRQADVYLTASYHEGFCVPLLEAMVCAVPIIAYNSTAIPETLGGTGILFNEKKYVSIAELINLVITDINLRNKIITRQQARLSVFDRTKIKVQLAELVGRLN